MVVGLVMSVEADVIQWTAPASCPDDAAVEERIAAFVDVPSEASPMTAIVVEKDGGFEVELVSTIDGEVQQRTLQAATCDALADAVAAVVAVTIDPTTTSTTTVTTEAQSTEETMAEPPPEPETTEVRGSTAPPPDADPPTKKPLQIGLRVNGGWGGAIVPGGSGIFGMGTSIGRTQWSVELEGRLWLPRRFDVPRETYGALVTMGTVTLAVCARPLSRTRVEIPLCGGLEGGGMRAAPRGLDAPSTRTFPWVAPLLRLGLRVRLRDMVGLVLLGEAAVPVVRAAIRVDGAEPLRRTQAVSVRVLAGLDFRWIR